MTQGDIADRLTIMELKMERGMPSVGLVELRATCAASLNELAELKVLNEAGWDAVETIHQHFDGGRAADDATLLKAFTDSHRINRRRVEAKNRINARFNEPQEAKSWKRTTI